MEGLLLGEGSKPIPEQYRHGGLVRAVFSVIDAIGTTFKAPVDLYVDRSNQSQNKFSSKARSKVRRLLFSERYVEPPLQPLRARLNLNGLDRERLQAMWLEVKACGTVAGRRDAGAARWSEPTKVFPSVVCIIVSLTREEPMARLVYDIGLHNGGDTPIPERGLPRE